MSGFEDFMKKLKGEQQEEEQPPAVSPAPTSEPSGSGGGFDYFLKKSGQESEPETGKPDAGDTGGGFSAFMAKLGKTEPAVQTEAPKQEPFQLKMAKAAYEQKQTAPNTETTLPAVGSAGETPFQLRMAQAENERKQKEADAYASLLPGYKPAEQKQTAAVIPSVGAETQPDTFSGRSGKIDGGGSQAYVRDEKARPDTRSGFEKFIQRVVGYDPAKVTGEKTDWGKLAAGTVLKGVNNFSNGFWKTADFMLGDAAQTVHDIATMGINDAIETSNSLFGTDYDYLSPSENLITRARKESDKSVKAYDKWTEANRNSSAAAQIVDTLGTATVQALPFLIETMLTQGATAPGQSVESAAAGMNYASALGQASGAEATGLMLKEGITKAVRDPSFWTSYVQTAGPSYEAAKQDGMDEVSAALYGLTNGFFNALIEIGGGIQDLDSKWWKRALDEAKEEVLQGATERGLKAPATGAPLVSFDPDDDRAVLNPTTAAQEAFGGFAVGSLLSGFDISKNRAGKTAAQTQEQTDARESPLRPTSPQKSEGDIPVPPPAENARLGETERLNTEAEKTALTQYEQQQAETEKPAADTGGEAAELPAQTGTAVDESTLAPTAGAQLGTAQTGTDLTQGQGEDLTSGEEIPGGKRSQTESNTLSSVAEKLGGEQNPLYYMPVTERQTLTEAVNRVMTDGVGEMERLAEKEHWTAADVDTAMTIYGKLQADGVRSRDFGAAQSWGKVIQTRGTSTAQALQAFAKWTRSGAGQASAIRQQLDGEVEAYQESGGKRGLSQEDADRIGNDVFGFAETFDSLEDGDLKGLRELIKRMSDYRGTGTFFEKNFMKLLNKVTDADYLREYALRQMQAIAGDATNAADIGQKMKTWQVNAQLSRLGTFFRNLGGNATFGIQDTLTQDGLGIAIDRLISRKTGKRTVGLDKSWFSSKARKQAAENLQRSILEIAGDVNMSGGESRYGTNASNRTFKMSGNAFDRFMSRWEQLLGYSLQSSDAFFRGQQEAAAREGLDSIDSGLTDEQKTQIAEDTADYRLFQNKGTAYGLSKGAHDILNLIGIGGEVDKAHPQRGRQGGFGLGDMANPYPGVPANLGAKVLEYSPANIVKGAKELVQVLRSVEMGTFDPSKQNQAVMDIARGMAGTPIIMALAAAFKSGVVRNSDDEEDLDAAAQNRAEGKTGVQINLDAWARGLNGEPTDWKDGDKLMSIGWLEPLNGFMAIASLIAQDDSGDAALDVYSRHYIDGALQSVRDIPAMQSISNIYDTLKYSTGETLGDKVKDAAIGFAGDALTGMIPAPISQTAKTIDPFYRDTGGDSKAEQVWNSLRNAVPGLRETLPVKQDNYGEPKKGPDSAVLRALNNLVLPGAVNELHQTEVSEAIGKLYDATGDVGVVPDRKAPSSVTRSGETHRLTAEEKREWQSTYGKAFGDMAGKLLLNADYDGLSDEAKAEVIHEVEQLATYRARRDLYKALGVEYADKSMQKLAALADADPEDAVRYLAARSTIEAAIDGGDYDAMDQFFDEGGLYGQLSDKAKDMLGGVDNLKKLSSLHDEGLDAETGMTVIDAVNAVETEEGKSRTQQQDVDAIIGTDLSDKDKLAAIRAYASESYAEKVQAAVDSGLSLEKWSEIYHTYRDIDDLDLKNSQKADQLAAALDKDKSLTEKQRETLLDNLKYYNMVPAEAKRYDQLKDAGADIDRAVEIADAMRGAEKQDEIVDKILSSKWSEADQWRALKVYASESYYDKAAYAYRRGIDLADYVRMFREADQPNDEGKRSGSLSQAELWDFYRKDPANEAFVKIMWAQLFPKTTWDSYRKKHGG